MKDMFPRLIAQCGAYALPFLVHLYDAGGNINIYAVNNTQDVAFKGNTYKAASFAYTPNEAVLGMDGGGKLEIAVAESTLLVDLVETYSNIYLDVTGVMATDGYVYELRAYKHRHGSINGNRTSITFTFEADDRLQMTFPALIWNNQNNRGNA